MADLADQAVNDPGGKPGQSENQYDSNCIVGVWAESL